MFHCRRKGLNLFKCTWSYMNFWGGVKSECKYFGIVESQKKKYVYLRESGGERKNIQIVYMENRLQYIFPLKKNGWS